MRWFIGLFLLLVWNEKAISKSLTLKEQRLQIRDEVRDIFYHAYDNYLMHAFPKDELEPLSCVGKDTWGSYSLTLIDALDTLLVLGNTSEFKRVVGYVINNINFDKDLNVSVFETNIRIVGALLSAHLLASDPKVIDFPEYKGELLNLTIDLVNRLLPAFETSTRIPYGTINLRHGIPPGEVQVTCTSGGGTFSLEFDLLSKLTGNPIYEQKARNAVRGLWGRRSHHNLLGNHINIATGEWIHKDAGIGHGIDSFYEYLLKSAIYFNDKEYMDIFIAGYSAVLKYLKRGDFYIEVEMNTAQDTFPYFNNLQAFWPGLQVLVGDLDLASRSCWAFHVIWKQRNFTPEMLNLITGRLVQNQKGYPLRPELVESTWYLSQAFPKEAAWFYLGRDMVKSFRQCKVDCGYSAIDNVDELTYMNRMDSYFLAETIKYLYLLFDTDNWVNTGNYILNTEAHIFPYSSKFTRNDVPISPNATCQLASPLANPFGYDSQWIYNQCSFFLEYKTTPSPPAPPASPKIGLPPIDPGKFKLKIELPNPILPQKSEGNEEKTENPTMKEEINRKDEKDLVPGDQCKPDMLAEDRTAIGSNSIQSWIHLLQQFEGIENIQILTLNEEDFKTQFTNLGKNSNERILKNYLEEEVVELEEYQQFKEWQEFKKWKEWKEFKKWKEWKVQRSSDSSEYKEFQKWKTLVENL